MDQSNFNNAQKISMNNLKIEAHVSCFHCGEKIENVILFDDKKFCCTGCKAVYQLLSNNNLCDYYSINDKPGKQLNQKENYEQYNILDDSETLTKLLNFKNATDSHVKFYIPYMHCSSCIYLLENMQRLNPAIVNSRVNFQKKEVEIIYHHQKIGLKEIAVMLHKIGYPPYLSMASETAEAKPKNSDRSQIYKIGIAGFAFGNIMMLSFPEYFHLSDFSGTNNFTNTFNFLSLLLALPVLFYCSQEFFISAYASIKQRHLNIDAPIALAILITFLRSIYEITYGSKIGYFDSMTGIVFFMLLGRYFQNKTFDHISFERDYKSYFPLGVSVMEKTQGVIIEKTIPVSAIKTGMRIVIRQNELIPADGILFNGEALVDYSFVTGEAEPVNKVLGEILYAGGRQKGSQIEIEVVKEVSQSYLTSLWNKEEKAEELDQETEMVTKINKYFSYGLLTLAGIAFAYWWPTDTQKAINAVTTILIVACPCALLLSATFTYGNVLQIMAKNKMYIKNAKAVERFAKADTIVFDKTGTITKNHEAGIEWVGYNLNQTDEQLIASLANESIHPLSKRIASHLSQAQKLKPMSFKEHTGKGIEAIINGDVIKLGSLDFVGGNTYSSNNKGSKVYVGINNEVKGYFSFKNVYRNGVLNLFNALQSKGYELHLLSGDNEDEKNYLSHCFTDEATLNFNQSPQQKHDYIENLSKKGKKVIMVGDGLNDAGALMKSYAGIAVTDDVNFFTPACSAILEGNQLAYLKQYLDYAKAGASVIKASFVISLLYNVIGLSFALTGTLQPVIAAILMPLSTISIVLFTTLSANIVAQRKFGFTL
jgi:Cu+-exporting ATPase